MKKISSYNAEMKDLMQEYLQTYFKDNNDVLKYLEDITKLDGNSFEIISKSIFLLNYDTNGKNSIFEIKSINHFQNYLTCLSILKNLSHALFMETINDENFFKRYKLIKYVQINKIDSDIINNMNDLNSVNYTFSKNYTTLILNCPFGINLKYDKTKIYIYNNNNNCSFEDIIKNHILFAVNFKEINFQMQIFAFYFYINILVSCFFFIYKTETILSPSTTITSINKFNLCNYYDNYVNNISKLQQFIKNKKDFFSGLKGYEKLIKLSLPLLAPNSILMINSCSHHLAIWDLINCVKNACFKSQKIARLIRLGSAGFDHPINIALKENEYLKSLTFFVK